VIYFIISISCFYAIVCVFVVLYTMINILIEKTQLSKEMQNFTTYEIKQIENILRQEPPFLPTIETLDVWSRFVNIVNKKYYIKYSIFNRSIDRRIKFFNSLNFKKINRIEN